MATVETEAQRQAREEAERLAREAREAREIAGGRQNQNQNSGRMSGVKSKCPIFSEDVVYQTFKTTCKAYLALHDVPEAKQGLTLAMCALPESGANNIRQRFFDEHTMEQINTIEGINLFWTFMDGIYEKDALQEMCSAMSEFFYYKRPEGTSLKDYVSEFEARYQRAIAKKVPKFSEQLLMWRLIEGSNLQDSDKRMVMVEVDLNKPDEVFKMAKNSMKKLFSGLMSEENKGATQILSDTFFAGSRGGFRGSRGGGGQMRARGSSDGTRWKTNIHQTWEELHHCFTK